MPFYSRPHKTIKDCSIVMSTATISGATGGAILLMGVAALAAWKAYAVREDRKEFKKFQRNRPKFTETNNPLYHYQDPITTVQNPMIS